MTDRHRGASPLRNELASAKVTLIYSYATFQPHKHAVCTIWEGPSTSNKHPPSPLISLRTSSLQSFRVDRSYVLLCTGKQTNRQTELERRSESIHTSNTNRATTVAYRSMCVTEQQTHTGAHMQRKHSIWNWAIYRLPSANFSQTELQNIILCNLALSIEIKAIEGKKNLPCGFKRQGSPFSPPPPRSMLFPHTPRDTCECWTQKERGREKEGELFRGMQ